MTFKTPKKLFISTTDCVKHALVTDI